MNPALWAAIIAAQQYRRGFVSSDSRWWASKTEPPMPAWPRFLLWLIRRRTQRRILGKTWARFDDWLWGRYFTAIEKDAA